MIRKLFGYGWGRREGHPKPAQPSITCPKCGRTSYNPNDIRERFCGVCGYHEATK